MHAFVTKPAAPNTAATGPAAATGPPLGSLAKRQAALKRADGDLFSVLDRYLDNSISTSEQEFTIEDFMEDDALSSYDSQAVEEVLAQLARVSPGKLIIDWGSYPP